MSKYQNCDVWLEPVRLYNPALAQAVEKINTAICLADDVADRQISPLEVSQCLWVGMIGVGELIQYPIAWNRIQECLKRILDAEVENLQFIPGKNSIEDELKVWVKRATLLDLYFVSWCVVDVSIDTKENWEWFERFKKYVLVFDDCRDILTGEFEDLIQCRRNFVVLNDFGFDGYVNWKSKKEALVLSATEIKEQWIIENPSDSRMKIFMR